MATQHNGSEPALQSLGNLKRWIDRYLGETYGVVPMHRISGSINEQQLGSKAATAAQLTTHEADTSTHGVADMTLLARKDTKGDLPASVAYEDEVNTFTHTSGQTIQGTGHGYKIHAFTSAFGARLSVQTSTGSSYSQIDADRIIIHDEGAYYTLIAGEGSGTGIEIGGLASSAARVFEVLVDGEAGSRFKMLGDGIPLGGTGTGAPTLAGFLTNLGISAFIQTLLNDADAATARATLGAAGLNVTNIFTLGQTIKPTTDSILLNMSRGTDTAPVQSLMRIRNAAESVTLFRVDANGKVFGTGLDAGSQEVTSVADATAATSAVNRQTGDARYAQLAAASTFTKKQIIAPDSDTNALDLRVGTGTTAPFRLRNNADSANLAFLSNVGKLTAAGAAFGSNRVEAVGDAVAGGDALNRLYADNRYQPLSSVLTALAADPADLLGTVWRPQGQALAVPASAAAGAVDRHRYCIIAVSHKCTVTGLRYKVGATSSGNVDCALFNAVGSKVGNDAAVIAQAAINTRQEVPFNVAVTINPGVYTALIRFTSATSTAFCWAAADFLGAAGEGSGAMPATQTMPTGLTSVVVPALTLY